MTPPRPLPFLKMQALGNDFIVVDLRDAPERQAPLAAQAARLCDRHFGVGADGLLLIGPSQRADAAMRVINADGSEAEMCGNGLRCVARYLRGQLGRALLRVETRAGVLSCEQRGEEVLISMGAPRSLEGPFALELGGRTVRVTAVSMGNPHAVLFVGGEEPLRPLAERDGPLIERHPHFPQRANVGFARLLAPGRFELWVWERGCGLTLACGTGACAMVVAACHQGLCPQGAPQQVQLPGGTLTITVLPPFEEVHMQGPAETVFVGTWAGSG